MSLLNLCQNVAGEIPVDVPDSIVGNTDQTASLLFYLAKREGESLGRKDWVILQDTHEFTTVATQPDYDMPADFSRLINSTIWDRTNYWEMRGPLTPQEWQIQKSSSLANTVSSRKAFRITGVSLNKKFSIDPVPDAVDTLVFEYYVNTWCESSGGTPQTTWQADTDVSVIDEYLIELGVKWRYLKRLGMAYAEERDEYDRELAKALARDGGSKVLQLNHKDRYYFISPCNVPDTGFGQ